MKSSKDRTGAPEPRQSVLVVDDAPDTLEVIRRNLESRGLRVFTATNVAEAAEVMKGEHLDLVVTDYKMPRASGLDLLVHVRENLPDAEVIMITGYATVEGAVRAIKLGAEEYLPKPFTDAELFAAVDRALEKLRLRRRSRAGSDPDEDTPPGFVGCSDKMRRIYASIAKAARTSATVLVTGESGTGKELVARAVHYGSSRSASPFVAVNCGGIPEGLLESELFGHVKGAFTGATATRAGFFQTADGGTVFLDEVSEMSTTMQVKLLRVLQEHEICMVGSSRTAKVDARVLAATNKSLPVLVEKGLFREDLYYRLNVIAIDVPPLRERGDDILELVAKFTQKYSAEAGRAMPRISDRALELLRCHNWPGNVRELENVIHRLLVMTDGDAIDAADLPALLRANHVRDIGFDRTLAEVEAEYIRNVLAHVDGNKTRAAEILGIDRKTLREKLKNAQG